MNTTAEKPWWQSLLEFAAGGIVGYQLGSWANNQYESCSPDQRQKWDNERFLHHGELGCMAVAGGAFARSPFVMGVGAGLMASDAKDSGKWFRSHLRA